MQQGGLGLCIGTSSQLASLGLPFSCLLNILKTIPIVHISDSLLDISKLTVFPPFSFSEQTKITSISKNNKSNPLWFSFFLFFRTLKPPLISQTVFLPYLEDSNPSVSKFSLIYFPGFFRPTAFSLPCQSS